MRVVRVDDPAVFEARVRPLLMQDEARNNLMFGILTALAEESSRFPEFHL